jgi:hypothetical protein
MSSDNALLLQWCGSCKLNCSGYLINMPTAVVAPVAMQTIAAGKPELLNAKSLERCLAMLAAKPIVPGYADMHVSLTSELETCQPLQELLAARK